MGITLDYKLDFDPHISNICKKAAIQLNVLERLKFFIGVREIYSCPELYLFEFRVLSSGLVFFSIQISSEHRNIKRTYTEISLQ